MGLSVGDVRPGKCFTTKGPRHYVLRVATVDAGGVAYESRGPKARKGAWSGRLQLDLEAFLAELDREVGCDYVFEARP